MWNADSRLLIKLWLRTPLRIATAAPSGDDVCAAMVGEVDPASPGWVVELGAGTGPVTRELLAAGVPGERLLAVESNPNLHDVLADRFPEAQLACADAGALTALFAERGVDRVAAVVSTLPILTMPPTLQQRILDQAFAAMGDDGRFVQITYMPGSPVPHRRLRQWGYRAEIARFIFKNFPPATIWRYTR